jgi:hypothetical protein
MQGLAPHRNVVGMHKTPAKKAVPSEEKLQLDFDRRVMFRSPPSSYYSIAKEPLPLDFTPSPYTVVIGRGNLSKDAPGNIGLKKLASTFRHPYSRATSKVMKTMIISRIVEIVRETCPVGAFVKCSKGRWLDVCDSEAHEKVGYVMRDLLHDKYSSSSKSKAAQRKLKSTGGTTTKQEYAHETSSLQSRADDTSSSSSSDNAESHVSLSQQSSSDKRSRARTSGVHKTRKSYIQVSSTVCSQEPSKAKASGISQTSPSVVGSMKRDELSLAESRSLDKTITSYHPRTTTVGTLEPPQPFWSTLVGQGLLVLPTVANKMERVTPTQNTLPTASYQRKSLSQRSQSWNELGAPAPFRPIKNTESWTTTAASRLTPRRFLNGAEAELRASDMEQQDKLGGFDDLVVMGLEIMEDRDFLVDLETIFD